MPYDKTKDPYAFSGSAVTAGNRLSTVTASGSDFTILGGKYPKALIVFVPSGTAGPHLTVLPAANDDGATETLTLPAGALSVVDFVRVRAVTAITAGVIVKRIDD